MASSPSSSFRLVHTPHPRWPLPPLSRPLAAANQPLRISVLDSSFNPPHSAHLALAQHGGSSFDARLLLVSSMNADKGEARDIERRLGMMVEMAKAMETHEGQGNCAVALIAEPTFVTKSSVLKTEMEKLLQGSAGADISTLPEVRLTFLLGWDTLIRFFAPRYYQPPAPSMAVALSSFFDADQSSVACARRGDLSTTEEQAFLDSEEVKPWAHKEQVQLFDLAEEARDVSSTEVRKAVKAGRWEDVERLVPLSGVRAVLRRERMYQ